jgi:hypothetical protein
MKLVISDVHESSSRIFRSAVPLPRKPSSDLEIFPGIKIPLDIRPDSHKLFGNVLGALMVNCRRIQSLKLVD